MLPNFIFKGAQYLRDKCEADAWEAEVQGPGAGRFQRTVAGCVSRSLGWFDVMLFPASVGIAYAVCCQTETAAVRPQRNYHLAARRGEQLLNEEEWDSSSRKTPRSLSCCKSN